MYSEFLENLILTINSKLKRSDLPVLYSISKEFTITQEMIIRDSLSRIVSKIIAMNLPYFVACSIIYAGEISQDLVFYNGRYFESTAATLKNEPYIQQELQKINKLLDES